MQLNDTSLKTNPQAGKFISLEGTEGVGKTTQRLLLAEYLQSLGVPLVQTREPGGTPFAEDIRSLLLSHHQEVAHADTELLLIYAARVQHWHGKIAPALTRGDWVLSDRFADASLAYQGFGRQLSVERIQSLHAWALADVQPHLTLWLNMDVSKAMARAQARSAADRIEMEKIEFFQRVHQGYTYLAQSFPQRFVAINADQEVYQVHGEIRQAIHQFLGLGPL